MKDVESRTAMPDHEKDSLRLSGKGSSLCCGENGWGVEKDVAIDLKTSPEQGQHGIRVEKRGREGWKRAGREDIEKRQLRSLLQNFLEGALAFENSRKTKSVSQAKKAMHAWKPQVCVDEKNSVTVLSKDARKITGDGRLTSRRHGACDLQNFR